MSIQGRRAYAIVTYDGEDISAEISNWLKSITVTRRGDGESADDVKIELEDRDLLWIGDWYPKMTIKDAAGNRAVTGDILKVVLYTENWDMPGVAKSLDCGSYEIDAVDFVDNPPQVSINATAVPLTKTIRVQPKSKVWERITLSELAGKIATEAGMKLMFEADENPLLDSVSQHRTSDLAFLRETCRREGFTLKVTNNMIVIFSEQKYEEKDPIITFIRGEANITSASFRQDTSNTAKAATVEYKDPKSGKLVKEKFEPDEAPATERELKINERPSDLSGDAIREAMEGE